jgi:hypothetical protein
MGSPAGSSGTGTGSTANVFTPRQQGTADFNFWQMLDPLINAGAEGGAGTPAAQAYSYALPFTDTLARGWSDLPASATGGNYLSGALNADQVGLDYADSTLFPQTKSSVSTLNQTGLDTIGKSSDLYGSGRQIMDLGFDPRNTEYNRNRGQALDVANVANASAGIGSSPYGASVTTTSLNDFDSKWEDKRLERAGYGAKTQGSLYSEGGALSSSGGHMLTDAEKLGTAGITDLSTANRMPFNDLTSGASAITKDQSAVSDLGTAKYALPESNLNALESYLGLGQSASKISGQLGDLGQSQLGSSLQGVGSAVGGVNSLTGGGVTSGLGSLFGAGGAATTIGADGIPTLGAAADISGGTGIETILSSAAPFALS